jgi:two-component system sensor kinase FixL
MKADGIAKVAGGWIIPGLVGGLSAFALARAYGRFRRGNPSDERLRESRERLAQTSARLGATISSAMDAIVSIDEQQRIVLFNPAAEKMFGFSAADALGQSINRLIPKRFRARHVKHVADFGRTGVTTRRMGALGTISGLRANGEEFPLEAAISQVDVGGEKLFTVILRDITERKRAEEALRRSDERLRAANRELTDFATIVSHDLKAPLRGVAMLARWLQSDYSDRLDAEGRGNLADIVSRIGRMDCMIDAILEYSRLGRPQDEVEPVALADLVASVVQDLAPPPRVQLRQLFQNLIGNAIKHADKPETNVDVDWADVGAFWEFTVADNGPGIEARHFDRIFRMFQTLAPKDETDSTGVGLALVKRIVELAGGRIWLESRVGEGSMFHFTWPKAVGGKRGSNATDKQEPAVRQSGSTGSRASSCWTVNETP